MRKGPANGEATADCQGVAAAGVPARRHHLEYVDQRLGRCWMYRWLVASSEQRNDQLLERALFNQLSADVELDAGSAIACGGSENMRMHVETPEQRVQAVREHVLAQPFHKQLHQRPQ